MARIGPIKRKDLISAFRRLEHSADPGTFEPCYLCFLGASPGIARSSYWRTFGGPGDVDRADCPCLLDHRT